MIDQQNSPGVVRARKRDWMRYVLMALALEKIIQHIFVTLAFYFDWGNIGATVAVNPQVLMILGAIIAVLFMLSLWGLVVEKKWAINLLIGLAIVDIVGEFIAQGTIAIVLNVSFTVATILLILAVIYRRQAATSAIPMSNNRTGRGTAG